MQEPTEEAEASIPTENVEENQNLNGTFPARRKAAKRTLPWDLKEEELDLVPSPLQDEGIRSTKRPRLGEPIPASLDEAATKLSSRETVVRFPAAADTAAAAAHQADTDPEKGTQATGHWTPEEDAKLNKAVTNTCKKKYGKGYRIDWNAVAALVPGRTSDQCGSRWRDVLDPTIPLVNKRTGTWAEDEDVKLKDAVQTHGDKNWAAISALVTGRTQQQCRNRWHYFFDPNIGPANRRTGTWAEDEDIKLKDAVQTHGGKGWGGISALVPGRTKNQCRSRWHRPHHVVGRTGKWTEDEDSKLKDAVQTHGGKNWGAIAALVPGRVERQCWYRWHHELDPIIDRTNKRRGKWAEDEDIKLKDAVQTHGDKNWAAITALVPGRTKSQCCSRWQNLQLSPK
jgi:hypothetical protein